MNKLTTIIVVSILSITTVGMAIGWGISAYEPKAPTPLTPVNPISTFAGVISVPVNDNGGNVRGRVNPSASLTGAAITEQALVNAGAQKVELDFDLHEAVKNYAGYVENAEPLTNNMLPDPEDDLIPFVYESGWELDIRVIVEIRNSNGVLVPRNATNPAARVLWNNEKISGNNHFWDANIIHNRGLGTESTGGVEHSFGNDGTRDRFDNAYELNATTLEDFTEMTFFVAGFVPGVYTITFRVAVATKCRDDGHWHFNTFVFNDLASVTKTFTVEA